MNENRPRYNRILSGDTVQEVFRQGFFCGILLFISSLAALKLAAPEGLMAVCSRLIAVLLCYLAAGCLIHLLRCFLSHVDNRSFLGAAAFAWITILGVFFSVLGGSLPGFVRIMILTSGVVLFLLYEAEYCCLKAVSKELNSETAGRTIVIDLEKEPDSEEASLAVLEAYCLKNAVSLEYAEKAMPATVKLNGRLHTVKVSYYYAYGGPVWYMEVREIL